MIYTINYKYGFKMLNVSFADKPYDVQGYDRVYFFWCKEKPPLITAEVWRRWLNFPRAKRWISTIDITRSSGDLLNSFANTTRYGIKRAEKEGVTIHINYKKEDFLWLLNKFIIAKKMWYKTPVTLEDFKGLGTFFFCSAYYKGKIIEAGLFAVDEGRVHSQFMCSRRVVDPELSNICGYASRYVYFKAMEHARKLGGKTLYLALGASLQYPTPLAKFKLQFHGELKETYLYYKNYNPILKLLEATNIWRA